MTLPDSSLCLGAPALAVLLVVAVTSMGRAFAQSAPRQEEGQTPLPEVVVTGSRIPVPANITATSPMTIVTERDILLSGHTDVVDVLNELPQTIINSSADYGNNSN